MPPPKNRTRVTNICWPRARPDFPSPSICRRRLVWIQTIRWPAGEVGKVGVAIDSLEDMQRLFDGIPLDNVSTSMTINATAAILLCLYLAVARKQNVSFEKVKGTLQNDILKEYIARGTYIYPPAPVAASGHRHVRVLRARSAQLEHDFDQRLSHSRSRLDRGSGSCVHARRRRSLTSKPR